VAAGELFEGSGWTGARADMPPPPDHLLVVDAGGHEFFRM
jgi:hypothetical protein